jgi:hypothetical protein
VVKQCELILLGVFLMYFFAGVASIWPTLNREGGSKVRFERAKLTMENGLECIKAVVDDETKVVKTLANIINEVVRGAATILKAKARERANIKG